MLSVKLCVLIVRVSSYAKYKTFPRDALILRMLLLMERPPVVQTSPAAS